MPTYARIDSGVVVELFTPPPAFAATPIAELFHADLQWVDVSALDPQPEPRWTYDGQAFASPAPPPSPARSEVAGDPKCGVPRKTTFRISVSTGGVKTRSSNCFPER